MLKKKLKKKAKQARNLVPENLAEHAANLNPLAKKTDDVPSMENVPRITPRRSA
jgi:hypothetical protein